MRAGQPSGEFFRSDRGEGSEVGHFYRGRRPDEVELGNISKELHHLARMTIPSWAKAAEDLDTAAFEIQKAKVKVAIVAGR
jgi:hypothetical protein